VSINTQIPGAPDPCATASEVVIGGVQQCGSATGHSYAFQNTSSPTCATLYLRQAALASGFSELATDVVITASQPSAPAPMYAIQYTPLACNSPVGRFWWFQRDCSSGNPIALPNLPLTNLQPVDVAAIR
jgi:hypothetical protein